MKRDMRELNLIITHIYISYKQLYYIILTFTVIFLKYSSSCNMRQSNYTRHENDGYAYSNLISLLKRQAFDLLPARG